MQKLPPVDDTVILEGLIKYRFVHHIRSTRLKCAKDTLLAGCFVFIPVDMSLPIHLKRKDICLGYPCCLLLVNHIATRIDDFQYLTLSKKTISLIGTEIRTEKGFSEMRLLSYSKCYQLSYKLSCEVFDLSVPLDSGTNDYELTVFIVNAPFVELLWLYHS